MLEARWALTAATARARRPGLVARPAPTTSRASAPAPASSPRLRRGRALAPASRSAKTIAETASAIQAPLELVTAMAAASKAAAAAHAARRAPACSASIPPSARNATMPRKPARGVGLKKVLKMLQDGVGATALGDDEGGHEGEGDQSEQAQHRAGAVHQLREEVRIGQQGRGESRLDERAGRQDDGRGAGEGDADRPGRRGRE